MMGSIIAKVLVTKQLCHFCFVFFVSFAGIYSKVLPYIIFGSFSIIAAILSLVLPDTRNCKFPDLISEAKPIRWYVVVSVMKYD